MLMMIESCGVVGEGGERSRDLLLLEFRASCYICCYLKTTDHKNGLQFVVFSLLNIFLVPHSNIYIMVGSTALIPPYSHHDLRQTEIGPGPAAAEFHVINHFP